MDEGDGDAAASREPKKESVNHASPNPTSASVHPNSNKLGQISTTFVVRLVHQKLQPLP